MKVRARTAAASRSIAREHNAVLRAGVRRAEELEERFEAVLAPVLDRAANEAARAFSERVTDFSALPPITAAAPRATSTMIALRPRPEEAVTLALPGGTPVEDLHLTLCYIGDYEGELRDLADALAGVALRHAPLTGVVGGFGSFADLGDGYPAIVLPDVPGLVELRVDVTEALVQAGASYARNHGFCAHLTLAYNEALELPDEALLGTPIHFDELLVVRGDVEVLALPLVGTPALTAGAEEHEEGHAELGLVAAVVVPPGWAAPAPDELLDIAALIRQFRGKTDPVRQAAIEAVMTEALERQGLTFDVDNPFTAKVLAQSGSQITAIAQTTQANVMRIIRGAYEQGLSVPDTAKAIRVGMKAATPARARMIARTELAGAVNSGSLAATKIVAGAAGVTFQKVWLTAGGAKHPRHALYPGLDGQTVPLDGTFSVGGAELECPADPSGPADEIVNCRCAVSYTEDAPEPE